MFSLLDKPSLPVILLRIGLAIIFMYAAIAAFANPKEWIGYLPSILVDAIPSALLLKVFSAYELLLAAWLLSGVYTRLAALVCAATLGGVILANFELFAITFRDIALIFAALALAALAKE